MDDYLQAAYDEAARGRAEGGIPIGSVLVEDGRIVARGNNRRVQDRNAILHAEMCCLQNAGRRRSYRGTTLYSTLMPCPLCAGAVVLFKIPRVVVGEDRNFAGAAAYLRDNGVEVTVIDDPACVELLREFIETNQTLWLEDIAEDDEVPPPPA